MLLPIYFIKKNKFLGVKITKRFYNLELLKLLEIMNVIKLIFHNLKNYFNSIIFLEAVHSGVISL